MPTSLELSKELVDSGQSLDEFADILDADKFGKSVKAIKIRKPRKKNNIHTRNFFEKVKKFSRHKKTGQRFIVVKQKSDAVKDLFNHSESYKGLTSTIANCCDFQDGACMENRRKPKQTVKGDMGTTQLGSKNGCCNDCANELGYLRRVPEKHMQFLSEQWDIKKGFLGKNGCKLGTSFRSNTCNGFLCASAKKYGKQEGILTDFEISFLNTMYETNG
jgi:hypothetical protein